MNNGLPFWVKHIVDQQASRHDNCNRCYLPLNLKSILIDVSGLKLLLITHYSVWEVIKWLNIFCYIEVTI